MHFHLPQTLDGFEGGQGSQGILKLRAFGSQK